jgi:Putative zinc-finger
MTPATTHCPEGVAPATLAAWRDGALPAAEAARVAAHAPECSACRAELTSLEMRDSALRGYPAPEPDERLWPAVREAINGQQESRHTGASARRLAGGLTALAAVVLLALGFAQVLHSQATRTVRTSATATASSGPWGTPTPLPTAMPPSPAADGPHAAWQQARLPIEPLTDRDILTYGIIPGHGESAYACHGISDRNGATLTFYRTADRALHWTTLKQLAAPRIDLTECMVQVDALDGNRVLVEVRGQNMQTFKAVAWYALTEDGGATWTRLDDDSIFYGLATLDGKTYALRQQMIDPEHATQSLSVSTDHLHTWQPIDQSLVGPGQAVANFWLGADGELLAEVATATVAPTPAATASSANSQYQHMSASLWRSSDGGAHWAAFPAPTLSSSGAVPSFVVEQPTAGQPWHICAQYQAQVNAATSLACTFDGGRTWSARPLLCTATPCDSASLGGYQYFLANDGAVITMALAPGSDSQLGLYRLPRGSATWRYLGPTPGSNAFFFAPTPKSGILWAYAGGTYQGRLSGDIGGHQSLPGVLSTATYP